MSNLTLNTDSFPIKRAIALVGRDVVNKLNEFYDKTSTLENDYKAYALRLIEQTLKVNSSGETKKALTDLLLKLGFKKANVSKMIGSQGFINTLADQNSAATDWVKSLPVSTSYVLGTCEESTFNKIWANDAEWGEQKVTTQDAVALKARYEKPSKVSMETPLPKSPIEPSLTDADKINLLNLYITDYVSRNPYEALY